MLRPDHLSPAHRLLMVKPHVKICGKEMDGPKMKRVTAMIINGLEGTGRQKAIIDNCVSLIYNADELN